MPDQIAIQADPSVPVSNTASTNDDGFVLKGFQFQMVMLALSIACFIAGLDSTIVVTAMPNIGTLIRDLSSIFISR